MLTALENNLKYSTATILFKKIHLFSSVTTVTKQSHHHHFNSCSRAFKAKVCSFQRMKLHLFLLSNETFHKQYNTHFLTSIHSGFCIYSFTWSAVMYNVSKLWIDISVQKTFLSQFTDFMTALLVLLSF